MRLTEKEKHILELVSEGRTNREIARALGVSEQVVKGRLTTVFLKLGVRNRTQAALKWVKR